MFSGFDDVYDQSARLATLRLLAEQNDYRLSDSMIDDLLASRFAINRGRGYVRTQLAWLENSAGAIKCHQEAGVVICQLTQGGVDHVLRRHVIPGIKRPGAGPY
ncbi:VpaChn25_0724 family phage protein [Aliihoeflea sp. PC F10.4]